MNFMKGNDQDKKIPCRVGFPESPFSLDGLGG